MHFTTLILALVGSAVAAPTASPQANTLLGTRNLHRRDLSIAEQKANVVRKYETTRANALAAIADGLLPSSPLTSLVDGVLSSVKRDAVVAGTVERSTVKRGTVALTDLRSGGVDVEYMGPYSIGSASQTITTDFDTGSSDLWVPVNCNNCGSTAQFAASKSSSYANSNTAFSIQYGSGSCTGTVATDKVVFGGYTASKQAFGSVTSVSSDFANSPSSGILGLAFPSIASIRNQNTVTQNIGAGVYGYRITRGGSGSELDVNGLNANKYTGSFSYTPLYSKTYWEVTATGMAVNGKSVGGSFPAAIDSGTTLVYVPQSVATAFWAQIPSATANGDGSYTYSCSFSGTVGVAFKNVGILKFSNSDLAYQNNGDGTCVGAVIGMDVQDAYGNNFAIVGDVFLKSWYTAFDVTNSRVGWASPK